MGPATEARGEGYHRLYVESEPSAAQLYIDEKLVGSTPAEIYVPFENPALGRTRGTIVLQVRKDGYVPEGIALFPTPAGYVSRSEGGPGMRTLRVELRRAQ